MNSSFSSVRDSHLSMATWVYDENATPLHQGVHAGLKPRGLSSSDHPVKTFGAKSSNTALTTPSVRKVLGDVSNSSKVNVNLGPVKASGLGEKDKKVLKSSNTSSNKPALHDDIFGSLPSSKPSSKSTSSTSSTLKAVVVPAKPEVEDIEFAPAAFVEPELNLYPDLDDVFARLANPYAAPPSKTIDDYNFTLDLSEEVSARNPRDIQDELMWEHNMPEMIETVTFDLEPICIDTQSLELSADDFDFDFGTA